jgi:hypothetical protein
MEAAEGTMGIDRDGTPRKAWRWIAAAALACAATVGGAPRAFAVDEVYYNPGNGHFYKWVPGTINWSSAKTGAEDLGGYLATITSAQEKDWVLGNLAIGSSSAWLGGTDSAVEGTWAWVNGESWSYTNWNAGEPNQVGEEDALMMYGNGTWNDAPITYTAANFGYVIEWDSDPNPPPAPVLPGDPTNLNATLTVGGTALVTWTDGSTNENSFLLQRKFGAGEFEDLRTLNANATQHEDDSLSPSTLYTYRVRAQNVVGPSNWSNEDSVTSGAFAPAPNAPSNLIAVNVGPRSADLGWKDNSSGEVAFEVRRRVGASGDFVFLATLPQDATAYHDGGLSPDETYAWQVRAIGTQRPSGPVATSADTLETLAVTPLKGDVKDGTKFGKDLFKFTAEFDAVEGASGNAPDPVADGITIRVGSATAPISLKIFPNAEEWTLRRTKWTWKSPKGSLTRLKVVWDTATGTLVVNALGLEMTNAPANPIRVSIVIGDEGGTDVREWTPGRKPGQFKYRVPKE